MSQTACAIVDRLLRADLLELPGAHEPVLNAIAAEFQAYCRAAAELDADAEKLADEQLRSLRGASAAGIDRRRVVKMIRDKLAKDRAFPV